MPADLTFPTLVHRMLSLSELLLMPEDSPLSIGTSFIFYFIDQNNIGIKEIIQKYKMFALYNLDLVALVESVEPTQTVMKHDGQLISKREINVIDQNHQSPPVKIRL